MGALPGQSAARRSWLRLPSGQAPGTLTSYSPLGRAGSKLAESTHSRQDLEPETAGDGER